MDDLRALLDQANLDPDTLQPSPAFPDTLQLHVPGEEAEAAWRRLRELVPRTGRWPVLLGPADPSWAYAGGAWEFTPVAANEPPGEAADVDGEAPLTSAEVVACLEEARGLSPDPQAWAEEANARNRAWLRAHGFTFPEPEASTSAEVPEPQPWWSAKPPKALSVIDHWTGTRYPQVRLALLPTTEGWQAPAYLGFGNFNDCPPPAQHACLLRAWGARYGAELAALSSDTLELYVTRPVRSREEALALAEAQLAYCPDRVYQGAGTVENLALALLDARIWHFWWD